MSPSVDVITWVVDGVATTASTLSWVAANSWRPPLRRCSSAASRWPGSFEDSDRRSNRRTTSSRSLTNAHSTNLAPASFRDRLQRLDELEPTKVLGHEHIVAGEQMRSCHGHC